MPNRDQNSHEKCLKKRFFFDHGTEADPAAPKAEIAKQRIEQMVSIRVDPIPRV